VSQLEEPGASLAAWFEQLSSMVFYPGDLHPPSVTCLRHCCNVEEEWTPQTPDCNTDCTAGALHVEYG
jgi:hypothetical protein